MARCGKEVGDYGKKTGTIIKEEFGCGLRLDEGSS